MVDRRQAAVGARPALEVVADLFHRLHANDVSYCHWKSNEHLDASMLGTGDLDVLVDRQAASRLPTLLTEANFKRFVARPGLGYPGIEDYFGFDVSTGTLVHLHLHYQLVVGEKLLKGYRLPWEQLFLSTRVLDSRHGVYVADPHAELVLLIARVALKLRWRDLLSRRRTAPYPEGGALRELRWLAARIDRDRLGDLARSLVGKQARDHLFAMLDAPHPTLGHIVAFRRSVVPSLDRYRTYRPLEARRQRWTRELRALGELVRLRARRIPRPSPRILPQGGLLVACLGADGAGKTTIAAELTRWLRRDVGVVPIYGGSGDGASSSLRRLVQRAGAFARSLRRPRPIQATKPIAAHDRPTPPRGLKALAMAVWTLALARERRLRAAEARRARTRGAIVIADRLPQSQHGGLSDGPRLTRWLDDGPWLLRIAARRELTSIKESELVAPDLVLKLHVSVPVAQSRKPDTPPHELELKSGIVRKLTYPPQTRVLDIDAEQPLADVVRAAKRAVWERI